MGTDILMIGKVLFLISVDGFLKILNDTMTQTIKQFLVPFTLLGMA